MSGIQPLPPFVWSGLIPSFWNFLGGEGAMDPYAMWGLQTRFRAFAQNGKAPDVLNFVLELDKPYDPQSFIGIFGSAVVNPARANEVKTAAPPISLAPVNVPPNFPTTLGKNIKVYVPPAYEILVNDTTSRFVTLRVSCASASDEEREAAVAYLMLLLLEPRRYARRLQIGHPLGWSNPDQPSSGDAKPAPQEVSPTLVVGVIEDSCPFAHAALLEGKAGGGYSTRLSAVWDQTTTRKPSSAWKPVYQFPYGQQMIRPDMELALGRHPAGAGIDEDAVYADLEIAMPKLAARASHAAAVMALVAGRPGATPGLPKHQNPDDTDIPPDIGALGRDAASMAPIVGVHLPAEQIGLSAGRWLSVSALDGLRYIVNHAIGLCADSNALPSLVVNMSYGATAGPHDGTGILEKAIDELVECYGTRGPMDGDAKQPGDMAVVLAAGNTNGRLRDSEFPNLYTAGGLHARTTLRRGGRRRFVVFIPPEKQVETFVEIWFDRILPNDQDGPRIIVTAPQGGGQLMVTCGKFEVFPEAPKTEAGLFFYSEVAQGTCGSMALLAVAATDSMDGEVSAQSGRWSIEVVYPASSKEMERPACSGGEGCPSSNEATDDLQLQAWVERDDTQVGGYRLQRARFVDTGIDCIQPTDENTFASISTGKKVFVAGALRDRGAGVPLEVSPYSATGSDEQNGPEFSAAVDLGLAIPGIRVSGSQSGMVVRANGTSMAAPQAARWLNNKLEAGKTLKEIRDYLDTLPGTARRGRLTVPVPPSEDTKP